MTIVLPLNSLKPLTQWINSSGIRKRIFRSNFINLERRPDHNWESNQAGYARWAANAGIPCLSSVSSGTVQRHVNVASGRALWMLYIAASNVHSLPKFCLPNTPKKTILLLFLFGFISQLNLLPVKTKDLVEHCYFMGCLRHCGWYEEGCSEVRTLRVRYGRSHSRLGNSINE